MPEEYRAVQIASLESQRAFLHAMLDSMPEDGIDDADTPGQRTFAGHVYHAGVANAQAVDRFVDGPGFEALDEASATASREALASSVDAAFDYMRGMLESQSHGERQETLTFAGGTIPRWQFWDELDEHTSWTLGAMVGNFRRLGMAPPAFRCFRGAAPW